MNSVSKPLLGVLLSAVVLFASVLVFFKSNSAGGGTSTSGVYQSAINQAKGAVKTSNAANARLGAPVATTPVKAPSHPAAAGTATPSSTGKTAQVARVAKPKPASGVKAQVAEVEAALVHHEVIGVLFYNPLATDDQAVKTELAKAATRPGVVKVAVPVTDIASFTMLTNTVPVSSSPTLIMIDRNGNASTISGFADRFEIAARLNALAPLG